jgi:hypothetical protein
MAKIYLSNLASRKTKGCHGPGRLLSIMVRTPHYVTPDGVIPSLAPKAVDFSKYKGGEIDLDAYRERFIEKASKGDLEPGKLLWQPYSFFEQENQEPVEDGDTLCCVCSKEKASKGECHRVWVAELLRDAGWEVILDGKKLK